MSHYDISKLGSGLIAKIAQRIDAHSLEGTEGQLDGKEISLFSEELSKKGIIFDFSKFSDTNYINKIEKQYREALNQAFNTNARAKKIIDENKNEYTFNKKYQQDMKGSFHSMYEITANKNINLTDLTDELDIPNGVISNNNSGYGQYDNNGSYIGTRHG